MTIYVGEGITVLGAAVNPVSGLVISDALAEVEFYAPGKTPQRVVADRIADFGPVAMTFQSTVANKDGTFGAYVGFVDTTGWVAGKWSYRVKLSGSYGSWEFGTFALAL